MTPKTFKGMSDTQTADRAIENAMARDQMQIATQAFDVNDCLSAVKKKLKRELIKLGDELPLAISLSKGDGVLLFNF